MTDEKQFISTVSRTRALTSGCVSMATTAQHIFDVIGVISFGHYQDTVCPHIIPGAFVMCQSPFTILNFSFTLVPLVVWYVGFKWCDDEQSREDKVECDSNGRKRHTSKYEVILTAQ